MQTPTAPTSARRVQWLVVAIFVATVAQLAVGTFARDLPQFAGKGFGARLFTYPLLMLVVPATWLLYSRRRGGTKPVPVAAFAFVMAPFLVDVTGNTLDLYDRVTWWDDANHFVNWFLLNMGLGLLLRRRATGWLLALLVTGVGAVLAIGWEIGEWYTFIRMGTELDTAYEDTLGDQVLGTLGAALAGIVLALRRREEVPVIST
jgi:uncharacterized membrane protein YjdF